MDFIHWGVVVYVAYANGRNSVLTDLKRWECHGSVVTFYLPAVATSTLYCVFIFKFSIHEHEYFEHYFQVSYV